MGRWGSVPHRKFITRRHQTPPSIPCSHSLSPCFSHPRSSIINSRLPPLPPFPSSSPLRSPPPPPLPSPSLHLHSTPHPVVLSPLHLHLGCSSCRRPWLALEPLFLIAPPIKWGESVLCPSREADNRPSHQHSHLLAPPNRWRQVTRRGAL